jgi:hypothetical protein
MGLFRVPGKKSVIAAVGVAAALGAAGTAYAATGSSSGGSTPASATPAVTPGRPGGRTGAAGRHHPRNLLQRADHATIELKVKGQWVTYTLDRGKVTAVSSSSITLARPDGRSVTETITPSTRYGGVAEGQVKTDRPAVVISDQGTALRINQRP